MIRKIKKFSFYLLVFFVASFFMWVGYLLSAGNDAAILMYHSVGEDIKGAPALSVSVASFDKQMSFLKKGGYRVIGLPELAELLRNKQKIAPKTVVITFDDGYENNYRKAFPILKKYGFPATIFIVVDFLGRQEKVYEEEVMKFMTQDMLKEMSDSGLITIGSHTKSHSYLPDIHEEKALKEEIFDSKKELEKIIGKKVYAFSYPIGGYTPHIRNLVRLAGYKVAVTTLPEEGFAHDDIYALKRIKVTEHSRNPFIFFMATSGYYLRMKEMSK